jgi:cation transport regulator ChaB
VEGWGKIVMGVVIGVAGTVYATNEDLRKQLPKAAHDLPDNVRQRFESAVAAAREASSRRREEILRELEIHDAAHAGRVARSAPGADVAPTPPEEATQSTEEESG